MEVMLPEERKKQYQQALQSAQELETTIGSLNYKLFKFNKMREEIDESLKAWWDVLLKELNLDPKANYLITKDGLVKDVTPKKEEVTTGPAIEVKPATVDELK